MKVQLTKALKYKDKELIELDLLLDELTGMDLIDVEKQVNDPDDSKLMILPEYSKRYLIAVAARAAHLPKEVLYSLGARDFTAVSIAVRNFLTGAGSGTQEQSFQEAEEMPEFALETSSGE